MFVCLYVCITKHEKKPVLPAIQCLSDHPCPDPRIQTLDCDPDSRIQAPSNPCNRAPRPQVSASQLNSILSEAKEQITRRNFES